jgi:NADH:ubiquinone oxidoreductase subunit
MIKKQTDIALSSLSRSARTYFCSTGAVAEGMIRRQSLLTDGLSMRFLVKYFTWWNSQTFGTQLWTWRFGERVGEDEFGNVYYRTRGGGIDPTIGVERRWVIYNGLVEGSRVPEGWNGWLHNTVDVPPSQETYKPREWQKPHLPNLTGTTMAYRPQGSILRDGPRAPATGDYDAWKPG